MTKLIHACFILQYVYYKPLYVSSNVVLIIRRLNCIDAASGIALSVSGRPLHGLRESSLAPWDVTIYSYIDVSWCYLFNPTSFIIPDGCIFLIQFYFDVFLLIYLFCLFCITNFYVFLTVHLSIILDNDQLDTHLLYFTIRLL